MLMITQQKSAEDREFKKMSVLELAMIPSSFIRNARRVHAHYGNQILPLEKIQTYAFFCFAEIARLGIYTIGGFLAYHNMAN